MKSLDQSFIYVTFNVYLFYLSLCIYTEIYVYHIYIYEVYIKPLEYELHTQEVLALSLPGCEYECMTKDSQAIALIYLINKIW